MLIINKAKEELEETLSYNDATREQEQVRIEQNYIEIWSDSSSSLSSDDLLETLLDDSSGSGKIKKTTKLVPSYNK